MAVIMDVTQMVMEIMGTTAPEIRIGIRMIAEMTRMDIIQTEAAQRQRYSGYNNTQLKQTDRYQSLPASNQNNNGRYSRAPEGDPICYICQKS